IGFGFLWPFLDKLFGLNYSTTADAAWINGGSPAQGYIAGIEGPFADFFAIFGNAFGDWLFMLGLFGIGIALITAAGLRIAAGRVHRRRLNDPGRDEPPPRLALV